MTSPAPGSSHHPDDGAGGDLPSLPGTPDDPNWPGPPSTVALASIRELRPGS